MSTREKFRQMLADLEAFKASGKDKMLDEFYEDLRALFVAIPTLGGFRWDQYTPTWNDGSACEFTTTFDGPFPVWPITASIQAYYDGTLDYRTHRTIDAEVRAVLLASSSAEYEIMFGTNVQITVERTPPDSSEFSLIVTPL
jgi:hypothetical protein